MKTDLFGAWLVETGRITQAQLDEALAITRVPARPLGQTLIEARHLSPEALEAALAEHLEARLREALAWRDGWYEFFEGVFAPRRVEAPQLSLPELVTELLERHTPPSDLETLFTPFARRPIFPAPNAFARHLVTLLPPDRAVIARHLLDRGGTLADAPGDEHDRFIVALLLHQADAIAFSRPASAA